jgi:hypothetical protein
VEAVIAMVLVVLAIGCLVALKQLAELGVVVASCLPFRDRL